MACPGRPVAVTIALVCLLALFGSYCQMAPAIAGFAKGWDLGNGYKYSLTTTVLFREAGPVRSGGDVGFQLTGEVVVTVAWKDPNDSNTFLLKIELLSPQLWIKSRKAPEPEGFVEHTSRVDATSEKPVFIVWRNGKIREIYMDPFENISVLNLKRGLASLFQYRTLDGEFEERDSSGLCNVTYTSLGPRSFRKSKTFCKESNLLERYKHPNAILGVKLKSSRTSVYELTRAFLPRTIDDKEEHEMVLTARPEAGTTVTSRSTVQLLPGILRRTPVQAESLKDAVILLEPGYKKVPIDLHPESVTCPNTGCTTFEKAVDQNRDALDNSALGTVKSAMAFLNLIPLARNASPEELSKLLKSPRYYELKSQLCDIMGSVATPAAHRAAMKILRQDQVGDDTERYLWALSMSPVPHPDIAKDILKRSEETMQNDRVSETLALTAAAMARQYGSPSVIEKARVSLELGLESCTGEDCMLKFLRALKNLRSKTAILTLLDYAANGSRAISMAAWRALGSLPKEHITKEIKVAAARTFYQIGSPRRDSSVRTLAMDVILETEPTREDLENLVEYLAFQDPVYEIRKYVSQRMEQIAERNSKFARNLNDAFRAKANKILNYNVLAQRGLSTAFNRNFLRSMGSNGSLVTIQEVSSGLLKRGTVDVVLETGSHDQSIFSLGLFASGLSNFVSSSEDEDVPSQDEMATAGMEIALLDIGVRPFIFFTGQGELMGHVWSGTASERTPAFQALVNLHHHKEIVPLASGFLAEFEVEGAVSFDLAGQIQLSLWSRNAHSLVEMGAGVAIRGGSRVRTNFVQSMSEFLLTLEPKLELATDVDFSGPVSLCMKLTQPETTIRHHVYKIERIPGSRHKLRKTRRSKLLSPAKSYHLNRKNSEMCSKVFS